MRASWIILGVLVGVPACSKDEAASGGGESAAKVEDKAGAAAKPKSDARKALEEAWKKDGLELAAMADAKAFGTDCQSGNVKNVELVICEQGSADEAKKAEAKALEWVGTTTGAAWTSGPLVIAVADRKKADPNGKTINQLMKSTPK